MASTTFNAKELKILSDYIDSEVITDLTSLMSYYNDTTLIDSLGESVQTHTFTFRLVDNTDHLLLSNGIYYDKMNDILHTTGLIYNNLYASLLLGHNIEPFIANEFYQAVSYPMLFTTITDDEESFVVIRNFLWGCNAIMNYSDITFFNSITSIDMLKSLVVLKNKDTYVTQKIEKVFPHELYYSLNKLDKFTPYTRENHFNDFSSKAIDYIERLNGTYDVSQSLYMAYNFLTTIYGTTDYFNKPLLNFNNYDIDITDDIDDILYHSYLGLEYVYGYKYDDLSNTIDVINTYINDIYNIDVDMMKYILPKIRYNNVKSITKNDRRMGYVSSTSIFDCTQFEVKSFMFGEKLDSSALYCSLISNLIGYEETILINTIISNFFQEFPDLSSSDISNLIFDITDWAFLSNNITTYIPTLIYKDQSSANSIYTYLNTMIIHEIIKPFMFTYDWTSSDDTVYSFIALNEFFTYLFTSPIKSIAYQAASTSRETSYWNALKQLNIILGIAPLGTNVFNPALIDDIRTNISIISSFGNTVNKFSLNYEDEHFSIADGDCKLEFEEDSTDIFFVSQSLQNVIYNKLNINDFSAVSYTGDAPDLVYMMEIDRTTQSLLSDIKLDKTKLQYIPVDIERSNVSKIPYKGLLLISDIVDEGYVTFDNLLIQRDYTTNSLMCRLNLSKYDQQRAIRRIKMQFYGDTEFDMVQPVLYEFGLGFELVSSDNISDVEMLRLIYIILDPENRGNNIYLDQMIQNPDKLKLVFRKLTDDRFTLRTVVSDRDNTTIIGSENFTV